jgi:hypothetical protein
MYKIVSENESMPRSDGLYFMHNIGEPVTIFVSYCSGLHIASTYQARDEKPKSENVDVLKTSVVPECVRWTSPPLCFEGNTMANVPNILSTFSELRRSD